LVQKEHVRNPHAEVLRKDMWIRLEVKIYFVKAIFIQIWVVAAGRMCNQDDNPDILLSITHES
jgi:hypothetical protein